MDQGGAGKSDLLKGNKPSINTTTDTVSYAHSALEPCYSWNNTYHPLNGSDQVLGFNPGVTRLIYLGSITLTLATASPRRPRIPQILHSHCQWYRIQGPVYLPAPARFWSS